LQRELLQQFWIFGQRVGRERGGVLAHAL
jgi:hypothetical protein